MEVNQYSIKKFSPLMAAIICLLLSHFFNYQNNLPKIYISKQSTAFNVAPETFNFTHFGQKRLIAAFLWITTLIESDYEHYKGKDKNSWMFLRFKNIAELSPYFYQNYYFGGLYLSVIKDDVLGAQEIYDQGLRYYPDSFWLNYHNAYNYYFELGDLKKALPLYEKALSLPESKKIPFLASLVAKIKKEGGHSYEDIYNLLMASWLSISEDTPLKKKYYELLYALKAENDLECLNQKKEGCSMQDLDGQDYKKTGEHYQALRPWRELKLKRKSNQK